MPHRVIVLGGGVAGMSAAHELAERGYAITVYETRSIPGGKARSMPVPGSGTGGRRDLPGEHGFRFFPGFYRHVTDTMKRIPWPGSPDGVFANLVPATEVQMARAGGTEIVTPSHFPSSLGDLDRAFARCSSPPPASGSPCTSNSSSSAASSCSSPAARSAASPNMRTRAGGPSRAQAAARPPTSGSWPTV